MKVTNKMFAGIYNGLAAFGTTDGPGSQEYLRVLTEYRELENAPTCPIEIAEFIKKQANALPERDRAKELFERILAVNPDLYSNDSIAIDQMKRFARIGFNSSGTCEKLAARTPNLHKGALTQIVTLDHRNYDTPYDALNMVKMLARRALETKPGDV